MSGGRVLRVVEPRDAGRPSWWFDDAFEPPPAETEPLEADASADVVIVGGGYTGLSTALALSERPGQPEVALLEAGLCGSQASGKNGGIVHGYWTTAHRLIPALGLDAARTVARIGSRAQEALAGFCATTPEPTWWTQHGLVKVSTTPRQDASVEAAVAAVRSLGESDQAVPLSAAQVQGRCASPRFRIGARFKEAATVHPARLARALRGEAMRRGVAVHERTSVVEVRQEGDGYLVIAPGGRVRARSVVLATNAGLAGAPGVRSHLTNFSSFAVMTAPAPEALEAVGWTGGEAIVDSRMFLHYFRTTPDGRVLMGTGSGPVGLGGRLGPRLTRDEASMERARAGLRWLLPPFADVDVERAWGGPIDVSSDHLPFFGAVPGTRVFYGCGFSGHGVNAGWIAGEALASLSLGEADEWTASPFCRRRVPWLPPEPVRYVGGRLVRGAILRCEEADQEARRTPLVARAAARLPEMLGMHIGTR